MVDWEQSEQGRIARLSAATLDGLGWILIILLAVWVVLANVAARLACKAGGRPPSPPTVVAVQQPGAVLALPAAVSEAGAP